MRTAVLNSAAMASVILLSSLFHSKSALADGFPAPSFAAARMFDVGLRPFSAIVNDFNGDNKLDLVVANEGSHPDHDGGGVSVFLGKGDGTFQAGANYAGTNLSTVAAGDLNGDSKPDLIVAYADGRVSMLLGNGDGTFQAGSNSSAGTNPVFVAVSDFNGDGKLDLAIANSGSDNVSVLLGRGDGTFRAAVGYDAGSGPQFVAVGDFNGDGKLDLAVANMGRYDQSTHEMTNSSVSVLLGNGDGTFQRAINYDEGTNPFSVAVGDFNNDGKLDLAIAHLGSPGSVSVLLSKGDGTFQAGATYAVGVNLVAITVGDFNRDGKLDLALANGPSTSCGGLGCVTTFDARVSVLSGKGNGTFEPAAAYSAGLVPASLAAGDFNGDGNLDLIEVDGYASVVLVMLGNGDGTLQAAANYDVGSYPASVAEGDFNSDGKPDLAVANLANISVLLGKGDGTFQAAVKLDTESQPWAMAVGDFNGDGKSDLAVANVVSNNLSVFLGKSDGTLQVSASYDVGLSPRSVATGDFNGDGLTDVAVANSAYGGGSPGISVLLGKGDGSFSPAVNYGAGIGPSSVVVGDFNGDSKPDLVVANDSSPGSVSVLLGKGDGSFQPPVSYGVGPSPRSVAAGDFNGDGRPDLAVANLALGLYSPSVSVLLGKGDGTFEPAVKYAVGFDPRFVAVSDFNGDGKPDLAVIYNNNVTVLLNTGASAGLRLGVARTNMGLSLSWPLPHADFVLESTTSVGSTNWQGAIESPMTNNGRLEVTAPLTQQQGYFRLRKP